MEFFLQQEGNLGLVLFLVALLVGLLYMILPIFIWRIWFWSRQNARHLQDIGTNLELLIRDIAPDALTVPEPAAEEPAGEPAEETAAEVGEEVLAAGAFDAAEDSGLFDQDEFQGEFDSEDEMEFSLSERFEDVSADIAASEISDFTDDAPPEATDEADREAAPAGDGEEELVMDFDEEDEPDGEPDVAAAAAASEPPFATPGEIPVSEPDTSDFTVEHFESNEEKTFEFEDVDDGFDLSDELSEPAAAPEESAEDPAASAWNDTPSDDIWGPEATPSARDEATAADSPDTSRRKDIEEFSFGDDTDIGAAFDEQPADESESAGETASSFLAELEGKLNLDSLATPSAEPTPPPEPKPEPKPEPPPAPKPAESQATLFARCEGCGHKLAYKQSLSGKRVRCPACRTAFALP